MNNTIKCPICHQKAKHIIYSGPFGLEEEYVSCGVCKYEFQFAYGNYSETVGNKEFIWSYRLSEDKRHQKMKKISKAQFMARKNWKKFKKTTNRIKRVAL